MEYRKLISFGKNSYVVSLPKAWVKQNKLKKGDVIYVDESKNNLILQANQRIEDENKEIVIQVDGKSLKRIHRDILGAYLYNYKTIKLIGNDVKDKAKDIQNFIQRLVAIEIVEQDSKKIIAKDFLNLKDISLDQAIKKMEVISKSMLQDCKNMFKEDTYENIYYRDQDINKFRFLVYRLVWFGMDNPAASLKSFGLNQMSLFNYWWLSFSIEQIGDCIKRIARSMQKVKFSDAKKKEFLQILTKVDDNYSQVLKAYHKQDVDTAHRIVEERGALMQKIDTFFKENKDVEEISVLTHNTKGIIVNINAIARIIYQGMLG